MSFALQILAYAAFAALILIVLPELFSRMIYRRSFVSTLAEIFLRCVGRNPTGEQAEDELDALSQSEQQPYSLPKGLKFAVNVKRYDYLDMPVYLLNGEGKGATVVYLHGGGYVRNPLSLHYKFLDRLAKKTDCRVVLPIYPKAPKSYYKDCYEALLPLCNRVLSESGKVIFMGDSSGGGLALGLYEALKKDCAKLPEKLVLFAPWVDLTMTNPQIPEYEKVDPRNSLSLAQVWAASWARGEDLKDFRLSPIYGDLALECKVYVFVGTHDLLYPDCVELHEKLNKSGTESFLTVGKGLNHVYPIYPTPEGRTALNQVAKIVVQD
ncbi:MAG: alpha/beta hydrolase fold domain-containing protein [Candidatus Coproplasma sp.]